MDGCRSIRVMLGMGRRRDEISSVGVVHHDSSELEMREDDRSDDYMAEYCSPRKKGKARVFIVVAKFQTQTYILYCPETAGV